MSEFGKRARAAGHEPDRVYALVNASREWEFDTWDELRMFWSTLERSEQLKCRTVLRSVWRR
jgi:hypothetical protein